ncbi:related to CAR2-ornithine aminotransferase [Phialocephala subalpina]|uniref:Ornithine aminotransferase n=1 Tax=Phialocephala subalpina TaxID=576137 RepID=A0A1L7XIK4_9HELO|nr:related to CAR2-ornithine aminotransferase [Phialocephala subalpina]
MGSVNNPYTISEKTQEVVDDYNSFVAGGFAPYPVALTRVKGAKGWDVDGKEYIDFLSMYSVVNMGHGHPKILAAAIKAMEEGAVINLPFHSPYYGKLAKKLHELFGYDKFVAMTSGAEAADAAVKIARKWGYMVKKIPDGKCHILTAAACYHGVTISTVSLASKKSHLFGPFVPSVGSTSPSGKVVAFGVIDDLKEALEIDGDNIAAFMIEPIQGSAGIISPPKGYLKEVAELCKKHNVLFICDEVQTGLGRTGANLSHLRENVRPDLVVLGKALAGGMYALSGVLGDDSVMGLLDPFEIGSTMAANPVGCAAAIAALDVLVDEKLSERANKMGALLVSTLEAAKLPHVKEIMGNGLFYALVLDDKPPKVTPRRIVSLLAQRGVLASAAGLKRIRICPPLTISKEELLKGCEIVIGAFRDIEDMGELPAEVLVDVRH